MNTGSSTTKKSAGFTDEEKAAVKARAQELKAEARTLQGQGGRRKGRACGDRRVEANRTAPSPSGCMRSSKIPHRISCRKPGTASPPTPGTARSSVFSNTRRSSTPRYSELGFNDARAPR